MMAFLGWTRWIQGIWKNQQKWAKSIIKAGLAFLRCSIFIILRPLFFSISSSSSPDWPFSVLQFYFSYSLFLSQLTFLLLLTKPFRAGAPRKAFWEMHVWATCRFICHY
jgi:hypothetical protein